MNKVDIFRKKYSEFIYKSYSWKISRGNLNISFDFEIEPDGSTPSLQVIKFHPKILIKNVNPQFVKRIENEVLNPVRNRKFLNGVNNLVFNLGLIELLSYWKAICSPEIIIEAGNLNKEQINWWKDLINRGMGQFFYENRINFRKPHFIKITSSSSKCVQKSAIAKNWTNFIDKKNKKNRVLVPIGGGKDSTVTLEILKKHFQIKCFSLNSNEAAQKIIKIGDCKNPIIVKREIDKRLLELNRKGFLNGHTPFSAYLAFLSSLLAAIFDTKYIAFSNERSSNEGNVKYLGRIINHQYSKSFDSEQKFRKYSKKYLAKDVEYFSFLRPLYEIQIAKLFSKYPKYFNIFLSCNEAFKTYSGIKKPSGKWCGRCPKCLFVFMVLYPFIDKDKLIKIFGENLFDPEGKLSASYGARKKMLALMLELIGERKFKPFECVGTKKESLVALYLSWKKDEKRKIKMPFLLKYFENKILPKYPNLEKEAKKIMNSWDNRNNLNINFRKVLTNFI
jgi:hypothetical protein